MKDILTEVKTKERSVHFLEKISSAIDASYSTKSSKKVFEDLPLEIPSDSKGALQVLNEAKEQILSAKLLDITVAVDLDDAFEAKLYSWFYTHGFKNFLLDVHKNPAIRGGVVLSLNGKYVDLSLKRKVCEYVRHKSKLQ